MTQVCLFQHPKPGAKLAEQIDIEYTWTGVYRLCKEGAWWLQKIIAEYGIAASTYHNAPARPPDQPHHPLPEPRPFHFNVLLRM
jgi:hypothetical protein